MNAAIRELLRQGLLQTLAPVPADVGLGVAALRVQVVKIGLEHTEPEIATELQYLADKGLVAPVAKTLSPENHRWRITADGRDLLAALGLA
jgi:hypothetical protein